MNVVVAGSSGLIGSALVERLVASGHRVTRLVRGGTGTESADRVPWDPEQGTVDRASIASAGPIDAAVNLAGAGIGDKRWSSERKRVIRDSRLGSTRLVLEVLAMCDPPPRVLVNASAVGYYGDRGPEILTEGSPSGTGFLADLCRAWEEAVRPASEAGVRTVMARSGIVLARRGGALGRQLPIFRLGLGERLGRGTQYRSWISLDEEVSAIVRCIEDESLCGPVNLTAPEPVTDAEFAAALGRALHRPAVLRVPPVALRAALGGEMATEMLLAGQRVVPTALGAHGFEFAHPELEIALRWVVGSDH